MLVATLTSDSALPMVTLWTNIITFSLLFSAPWLWGLLCLRLWQPGLLFKLFSWLPLWQCCWLRGFCWNFIISFYWFSLLIVFSFPRWSFLRRRTRPLQSVKIFSFIWLIALMNHWWFPRIFFSFIDLFKFFLLLFWSLELHFSWRKLMNVRRRWRRQRREVELRRARLDWLRFLGLLLQLLRLFRLLRLLFNKFAVDCVDCVDWTLNQKIIQNFSPNCPPTNLNILHDWLVLLVDIK